MKLLWYKYHDNLRRGRDVEVSKRRKHIEPAEMKCVWFDVMHLFQEFLNAFDWLPNRPN